MVQKLSFIPMGKLRGFSHSAGLGKELVIVLTDSGPTLLRIYHETACGAALGIVAGLPAAPCSIASRHEPMDMECRQ